MELWHNCLTALISMYICYQLTLAYIGERKKLKNLIIPVIIFTVVAVIAKMFFKLSPAVYTVMLVAINTSLLWIFNDIKLIIGLLGSLMTYITNTLSELLITGPILLKLGLILPVAPKGVSWFLLNYLDCGMEILYIIAIRINKFSINNLLATIDKP